jgi:hypothetical protein
MSDDFKTSTETTSVPKEPFWLTTSTYDANNLPEAKGFEVTNDTVDIIPLELSIPDNKIKSNTEIGFNALQNKIISCIFGTLGKVNCNRDNPTYWDKDHLTSFFIVGP